MNSHKMNISTSQYEFSHARKPRGNGLWIFFENVRTESDRDNWSCTLRGNYGKVKLEAIRKAKAAGITTIKVGA